MEEKQKPMVALEASHFGITWDTSRLRNEIETDHDISKYTVWVDNLSFGVNRKGDKVSEISGDLKIMKEKRGSFVYNDTLKYSPLWTEPLSIRASFITSGRKNKKYRMSVNNALGTKKEIIRNIYLDKLLSPVEDAVYDAKRNMEEFLTGSEFVF